jgi:hypothetical protein
MHLGHKLRAGCAQDKFRAYCWFLQKISKIRIFLFTFSSNLDIHPFKDEGE